MPTVKLTKRVIDAATPKAVRYDLCDFETRGLRLRVHPTGQKTFQLYYRTADGTERRPRIGVFGELTLEQARSIAKDWLARVRGGDDPSASRAEARRAPTVADLAERYLSEHARPHKKPRSVYMDEKNLANHILPRLGAKKVKNVTYADVADLHHSMRDTPGAANRVVALISKMFNLAERWGLRPLNSNPARHLEKYRERKLHRDLTELELARLAKVLREAEEGDDPVLAEDPVVIDAIRLILFTGCRRGEILNLRWSEVDLERGQLRLADSKTGAKVVALNSAAIEVIRRQHPIVGSPFVFPGRRAGKPMFDIKGPWQRLRSRAGLEGVRVHDLRHNFASFGAAGGFGLPVIGRLLGHKSAQTTARYADVADDPARRATEAIGKKIAAAMKKEAQT